MEKAKMPLAFHKLKTVKVSSASYPAEFTRKVLEGML